MNKRDFVKKIIALIAITPFARFLPETQKRKTIRGVPFRTDDALGLFFVCEGPNSKEIELQIVKQADAPYRWIAKSADGKVEQTICFGGLAVVAGPPAELFYRYET